jgi:hypothetical protein
MAYTDIDKPTDYFETVTYTGNGTGQDITTLDFQPDWLWIKRRDSAGSHRIQNSITGTTNYLQSNKTNEEQSGGAVDTFLSNGFSLNTSDAAYNGSGATYVGWSWLGANGTASNTDGSITSTVSANTTSGFSIVSYTGSGSAATIGHGLSTSPSMILVKNRSTAYSWIVYHKSLGATKNLYLDLANAADTASIQFNDTEPTSSVFSVGTSLATNKSGDNLIAYCFAEKKGFSKFGSYTGNNNADGSFIYTGFKPAFILIKNTTAAADWHIRDNKRDTYNASTHFLLPNLSDAEVTLGEKIDLLSNGFKIRQTGGKLNDSGNVYIYMAFAENPFVTSTGIPACAR